MPNDLPAPLLRDLAAVGALTLGLSPQLSQLPRSVEWALGWLSQATGAESAELFLAEPGSGDVILSAQHGPHSADFAQRTRFAPGQDLPGLAASTGRVVVATDLSTDRRWLRTRVRERGYCRAVHAPLPGVSGVTGVIGVISCRADLDLARTERLLAWAAAPLAAALSAALLDARQSAAEGNGGPLDALLPQLLHQAVSLTAAEGGAMLLLDGGGAIGSRAVAGSWPEAGCAALLPGAPAPCPVLSDPRGVVLCAGRDGWPAAWRGGPRRGAVSYCLPIATGQSPGGPAGLLQLGFRPPVPAPATSRLRLAAEIAAGVAAAVRQVAAQPERALRSLAPAAGQAATAPAAAESPAYLQLRCLGSFELRCAGQRVSPQAFHWRRAETLLKILVANRGRPVPRDTLIELLWPGAAPHLGANRLYVVVHALRKVVEPPGAPEPVYILSGADAYCLAAGAPIWLDVDEFLSRIRQGERAAAQGELVQAAACFAAALDLYRGDFLADEPFAEWCWQEREHLHETCLDALWRAAAVTAQLGHLARSADYYRRALRLDPLREESLQGLLRVQSAAGRPAEALREYQRFEERLQRELGIGLLPETRVLASRARDAVAV